MAVLVPSIDDCKKLLEYRSSKNGGEGYVSPANFNLLWPRAEIRYYNKLYLQYADSQKISDSLSKFVAPPLTITIDGAGKYTFPTDFIHADSIWALFGGVQVEITRVEKDRIANNLSSAYDAPDTEFPIYTQYNTYLQFYPVNLDSAILNYLGYPTTSFWGYNTIGGVKSATITAGGSGYANGTSTIALTGGSGTGATANVTVSGGVVTAIIPASVGKGYKIADVLGIMGSGTGFAASVASLVAPRAVYDATQSVQPLWSITDIDQIVALALVDIGQNMADPETVQYSELQSKQA